MRLWDENIIQKSETNIIEVIRDNINKQKCLKVMKCILVFIFICVVSVIGFTIYRLKKPQNYISPVAKDSIEMQTAELLAKVVPNSVQSSLYRKNSYTEFFARAQFIKDFLSRIRYNFSKPGSVSDSKMLRIPLIFGITFLFIL